MGARILGIESSCDETAAAVVVDGRHILSSVVATQIGLHAKYGGIVPELASREHLRQIVPVVREALSRAHLSLGDLDAVGVTCGPGLIGSLLVGVTYGKVLAMELGKPLLAVNHLDGHVHAVFLEAYAAGNAPQLPAVCLIVSGGHTLLYYVESGPGDGDIGARGFRFRKLGGTRDDAAGEAFDKVARLLGLGYPGGPVIDKLAAAAASIVPDCSRIRGGNGQLTFGPVKIKSSPYDFSFSGMKTAALYYVRNHPELDAEIETRRRFLRQGSGGDDLRSLCSAQTLSLIASFQTAVVEDLVARSLAAATETGARTVLVSGGVAANSDLRRSFRAKSALLNLPVFFPSGALSTDNAAMIAAAAYPQLVAGKYASWDLNAEPGLKLA